MAKKKRSRKTGRKNSPSIRVSKFDMNAANSLILAEAPKSVFAVGEFELKSNLSMIESKKSNGKPLIMKKDKQIKDLRYVLDNPLKTPYVYAISGHPNDSMAKAIAGHILVAARVMSREKTSNYKDSPMWHTLLGTFADKYRDKKRNPAALVISNVYPDITQVKQEKLRDLLEMYCDIPRIVVMAGLDPVEFFTQKLFYPLNYVMFLKKTISETEI